MRNEKPSFYPVIGNHPWMS